ncbi:MAG: hypothetical protein KGH66_00355 [Candidatus Micrarchaeota archaeon]|nr:hypothetical protein [Candidatus Micrarchaeota archaeon]
MAKAAKKEKGKGKKTDKPDREIIGCFIKADSLLDLARHVCEFQHGFRPLNAVKSGSQYRLFSPGERIRDVRLLYYFDVPKIAAFMVYNPWGEHGETLSMRESIANDTQDFKSFKIPIMEVSANVYGQKKLEKKDFKSVKLLEAKDYRSMIKTLLIAAGHYEAIPKLFSFQMGGERAIGTFDMSNESGMKVFTYAKAGKREKFNYVQYNYNADEITMADRLTEKSNGSARIVNVEALPFI